MVYQKRTRQQEEPPSLEVKLDDGTIKIIEHSKHCRLLGANIQEDSMWKGHLESGEKPLLKALRSKLGALKFVGKHVGVKGRLFLPNEIIISRILYLLPKVKRTLRKFK